jgi:hypothetical protein
MATVGTKNPTLSDVANRLDPKGTVATIVELLNETNEILKDATFMEANDGTNNKTTVRTGLPNATWRKLYQGVQPSKSVTAQVSDSSGMLEAYAEADVDLVDKAPDPKGFRLSEERPFIEVMSQNVAATLFYGDTAQHPERFTGLTPRYNALSTDDTKSGYNIINGAGTNAQKQTSMWLIVWGPNTAYMFYPRGSKAGLMQKDLGETTKELSDGSMYQVYRSHYKWDVGFTVRDWRAIVRIANIDHTKLTTESGAPDVNKLMIKALHRLEGKNLGRAAFYCHEDVITYLDIQTWEKSNLQLTYKDVQGEMILTFRGIPIRQCDQILTTEEIVS